MTPPALKREAEDLRHATFTRLTGHGHPVLVAGPTTVRKRMSSTVDPQGEAEVCGERCDGRTLCPAAGAQRRYLEWKIARLLKRGDENKEYSMKSGYSDVIPDMK